MFQKPSTPVVVDVVFFITMNSSNKKEYHTLDNEYESVWQNQHEDSVHIQDIG